MASQKSSLLILFLVSFINADCIVKDKSTKEHAKCVFPFTFNYKDSSGTLINETFYGCTRNLDPDDKPWCSTKVDSMGIHQAGHWGHCETNSTDCNNMIVPRLADHIIDADCIVEDKATKEQASCVFPFTFNYKDSNGTNINQTFYGCTTNLDPDDKPWCSTKVDSDGLHQHGHWGHCETDSTDCSNAIVPRLADTIIVNERFFSSPYCPCIDRNYCPWFKQSLREVHRSRNTAMKTQFTLMIRGLICDKRKRRIKCCTNNSINSIINSLTTAKPNTSTPKSVNSSSSRLTSQNIQKSGAWKPSGRKSECGTRLSIENIVGGRDAELGDYPFAALMAYQIRGKKYYLCGGSVINSKYVLTAAHCHSDRKRIIEVRVGELDLQKDPDCNHKFCAPSPQDISVERVIQHENWNINAFEKGFDIALVRLKSHIHLFGTTFESFIFVSPVCLPWPSESVGDLGTTGTIIGWGRTTLRKTASWKNNYDEFGASVSNLQVANNLPVVSQRQCLKKLPNITRDGTQFCAGEKGIDTCSGDSGGAFISRRGPSGSWYQLGIVSYGSAKCGEGIPGVYTKVSSYMDWIERNLRP